MKELNNSYRYACLQCSFNDTQLSEYIQYKRRKTEIVPVKYAVSHVGLQQNGMWVLGDSMCISSDGDAVPMEGSIYMWLGSVFKGVGVADDGICCRTTAPLHRLMCSLKAVMKHNFLPCILTMAGNRFWGIRWLLCTKGLQFYGPYTFMLCAL